MPTRRGDSSAHQPDQIERSAADDAARLEALRKAVQVGWEDLDAGRYVDIDESDLDAFVGKLGRQATDRVRASR